MSYGVIFCNIYILPDISISLLKKIPWNDLHPVSAYYIVTKYLYLLITTIINTKALYIKAKLGVMVNI